MQHSPPAPYVLHCIPTQQAKALGGAGGGRCGRATLSELAGGSGLTKPPCAFPWCWQGLVLEMFPARWGCRGKKHVNACGEAGCCLAEPPPHPLPAMPRRPLTPPTPLTLDRRVACAGASLPQWRFLSRLVSARCDWSGATDHNGGPDPRSRKGIKFSFALHAVLPTRPARTTRRSALHMHPLACPDATGCIEACTKVCLYLCTLWVCDT